MATENLMHVTHPPALPGRDAEGHKGTFGRVLVVGGNDGMIGAPVFAATAALRMGAGLVQIAVPRAILPYALSLIPECIGLSLGKAAGKDELLKAAETADAVVVGPGLGRTPEAEGRLTRLVRLEKPMVLDADALNLLAAGKRWPTYFKALAVLTPHPGEMQRLSRLLPEDESHGWRAAGSPPSSDDARLAVAAAASRTFGQVVVLKGHRTVVTDGHQVYINGTGDSTLSKAGSGDVLSGLIGCLLAQGLSCFDAACIGCYLHGLAGEMAGHEFGRRSALARDVLDTLPAAIRRYERL